MRHGTFVFIALSAGWLSLSPARAAAPSSDDTRLPRLMLWAWERPTDLQGLRPDTGVAFLFQTLIVQSGEFTIEPRRNPLHVAAHTPLVAVTRIESGGHAADVSAAGLASMAAAIAHTARLPRVTGIQIDFDAAATERGFYRQLLHGVRRELGDGVHLSMTALASWCAGDRWLDALPVDETVPMLFRLGPVNEPYAGLARSSAAAAPPCRAAIGTSLDEPLRIRSASRRVYVFNPAPWTAASVARASEILE